MGKALGKTAMLSLVSLVQKKEVLANGDVQWVDIMEQVSYGYSLNVGVDPIINGGAGKSRSLRRR